MLTSANEAALSLAVLVGLLALGVAGALGWLPRWLVRVLGGEDR